MKLFYTTNEVCQHLDIPKTTMEYYIHTFKLKIRKMGRNRKFTHQDIEKLEKIVDLVQHQGFTIEGAKEQLKAKDELNNHNQEIAKRLKEIKKSLIYLRDGLE